MNLVSDSAGLRQKLDQWATREGFASSAEVPLHRANELINEVAKETSLEPAVVRDALLASASAANEKAKSASNEAGTNVGYQGARGHKPLPNNSPLAALMARSREAEAKTKTKSAVDAFAARDGSFAQVLEDFKATRIAVTDKAKPKALEELNEACTKILARFHQIQSNPSDAQLQNELIRLYKDLLSNGAKDRGIFLTKADPAGPVKIRPAEEPAPAATTSAPSTSGNNGAQPSGPQGTPRDARYEKLGKALESDGTPELSTRAPKVLGDTPTLGVDTSTGEKFVFDFHGRVQDVFTIEGFVKEFREVTSDEDRRTKLAAAPESVEKLRSVSDKAIARLSGNPTYVSLLEDRETNLTRVYPCKWHKASGSMLNRLVVTDGAFKGVFLDDLVNAIAATGKGFSFDPKLGPSTPITPRTGEPWITTAKVQERGKPTEKLYVRIPFESEYTQIRQALRRLTVLDPTIKYEEGSKNTGFYFPPERYKVVRDVLKGTVLSPAAKDKLETYFAELTKIEAAASHAALEKHTTKAIGGFRTELTGADGRKRPVEMSFVQRKSLAMMEALGYRGVLALGTGMGKTLAAIGVMQELKNRHEETRPFLIVCPKALRGNFAKEIHKFLEPKAAKELVDNLVVLDYQQFSRAASSGELNGKPFKPEKFGAVIFDESQWIRNRRWKAAVAALSFNHPRKICMSASVMKDSFDDAMTQVSVAANINLADRKEGKELRAQARKFKNQSCVEIGGRTLGVKQEVELSPGLNVDPKHDLYTWVRKHIIYADKRMDDTQLPKFRLQAETLIMPRGMEEEYRKKTTRLEKVLRGMVSLYRDKGVKNEFVDERGRTKKEMEPLARNKRISQVFGPKLKSIIDEINALGNTPEKLDRAGELISKQLETNPRARAVLFSDSASYVLESAKSLSNQIPGKLHVACLANEIRVFQNGAEVSSIGGHKLPFKPGEFRRDMNAPADPATNRQYGVNEWQQFVLSEVIGPNQEAATTTMFGPVYQEGQNLQWANVGIHLDRDTWNRQNTLQREGRLWRKDQKQEVSFYNLDWVFRKPEDHLDRTLDEIRAFHEQVGEKLFEDMIVVPQKTVTLGEEWSNVRNKSDLRIDFSLLRYGVGPSVEKAGELEGGE